MDFTKNPELEMEAISFQLNKEITEYIKSNKSQLSTVAELLGASNFLTIIDVKGQSPVFHFDVKSFVNELKKTGNLHILTMPESLLNLNQVFLPPDESETILSGNGEGVERKKIIPRSRYLMELLTDLKMSYSVSSGVNTQNMMRQLSYQAFFVSDLNTVIMVNNEEGNATYIIHQVDENDQGNNWEFYSKLSKNELKELGSEKVSVLNYPGNATEWTAQIKSIILNGPFLKHKKERKEGSSKENSAIEKAPEGWFTNNALAKKLNRQFITIKKISEKFRQSKPDWFKNYNDNIGRSFEYFSPELVKVISEEAGEIKNPPNGWENNFGLSKIIGVSRQSVQKIADQYRQSNPDWFENYSNASNQSVEYYSPELVKLIVEKFKKRESAPDGWMVNKNLAEELERSHQVVADFADKFRESNPEWFKVFLNKRGAELEHYHPDLVKKIIENFSNREKTPVGWFTVSPLAGHIQRGSQTILNFVDNYRISNPEWFRNYDYSNGKEAEHFHPDLVKIIYDHFSKREKAPTGWVNRHILTTTIHRSEHTILNFVDQYRLSNPEWFGNFETADGRLVEHFSPELVDKIKKEYLERGQAPAGWLTNSGLAKMLKRSDQFILKLVKIYRETNPQWFKKYDDVGGHLLEHYSPELIEKIKEELSNREKVPEGWVNNYGLARKINKTRHQITKFTDTFRLTNPEYFKVFEDPNGQLLEFYSPELVQKVKVNYNIK